MQNSVDKTQLAMSEVRRLTSKLNKEYLDCNDLMLVLNVGRDNVRALMLSRDFPTTILGKRKVVSILEFVLWQLRQTA